MVHLRGRRIVMSGGVVVVVDKRLDEIRAIHAGEGFGPIIGRTSSQHQKEEADRMLVTMMNIDTSTTAWAQTR